jgi:7-cyano-7-deazaguanine synthase in queuosine biosynthesis
MTDAVVHVAGRAAPLSIRINGPNATFFLGTDKLEAQLLTEITPRYYDFLEIASVIFAADGTVRRGGNARAALGSDWRRGFNFEIPVRDPEFWSDPEVIDLLVETASFLTDDDYAFDFSPHEGSASSQPYLDLNPQGALFPADDVVLFSGGLDSYAGALDLLANSDDKVILVTHRSAQKVIPRQVELGEYLSRRFPDRVKHLHLVARRKGAESKDTTQRSRTLLFTAIGAAVCQGFEAKRINFFENGVVSHNLPISPQVVGTMATRTTHPLALHLLERLVAQLGDPDISVRNRYEWLTKIEVVRRIKDNTDDINRALFNIERAVSCTNVRDQNKLETHCGACSQCLDRRFAVVGAALEKFDPAERYATDVLYAPRTSHHSRVMAVEWTRHAASMADVSERELMNTFGQDVLRIARGYPDLPIREVISRMIRLHQHHGENVRSVLRGVIEQALSGDAILDPQSLVALQISGSATTLDEQANPDPTDVAPDLINIETIDECDVVPDPLQPLAVSFFHDERRGRKIAAITVVGLCDVRDGPAEVAHRLKPSFDEDRRDGLAPEAHRYHLHWQIWHGKGSGAFRRLVQRCRDHIARAYEEIHGAAPPDHLLIQNRPLSGYRLDPTIELVARERLGKDGTTR